MLFLDRAVDSVTFIPLCSPVCISEQFLTGSSYKLQFSAGDCEQEARCGYIWCFVSIELRLNLPAFD